MSLDPLCVAVAFLLLMLSALLLARRQRSWVPTVSAVAFGYCTLGEVAHFALQFVPDSRSLFLGGLLVQLWFTWPAVFLVGSFVLVMASFRRVVAP